MVFRPLITRYPTQQFRQEMDRLLADFFGNGGPHSGPASSSRPPVNAWETSEAVEVEVEVPGVKQEHIEISVVGNELALKIERPEVTHEGVTYHRRERGAGTLSRVMRLPVEVDADRVSAELRNGILTITLPKAAAARPRKIQVTTA